MSTLRDGGGPAFPSAPRNQLSEHRYGMSVRDYFAARAMEALIAKLPLFDREGAHGIPGTREELHAIRQGIAESAYSYADAMLAEREKSR